MSRGLFARWPLACVLAASVISACPALAKDGKAIDWDKKLKNGRYELSVRNVDKAIALFAKEVKDHPEAGPPHTELGKALKLKGRLMEAKAEFRRSSEVEPGYADAWYELGSMEAYDKEYQLAVEAFERFLQLAPYSDKREAVAERIRFCKGELGQ